MEGNYSNYDLAHTKHDKHEILDDEWQKQTDEAVKGIEFTRYQLIADYMGVGVQRSCKGSIDAALQGAAEWDRAGQQAASVIMALLPSLLTFGSWHSFYQPSKGSPNPRLDNLDIPRSSEAFGTSFLVGFLSVVFDFGLPVKGVEWPLRTRLLMTVKPFFFPDH